MNDRIHDHLDGELPREALTPAELARLAALQTPLDEAVAELRATPVPDLTERIMASLPAPEAAAAPAAPHRPLLHWLWRPRTFSFTYRPAYAMAGLAAAALAAVLVPLGAPAPVPAPVTVAAVEQPGTPRLYVQFRIEAPSASEVRLAGSFTGWEPLLELREVAPGVWSAMVPLEPGVHDYTFLLDGERWVVDPYAPSVDDSFGGSNSRLFLPPPSGTA